MQARARPRRMLPALEILALVVFALLPLGINDYLTVFFTRVLILVLLSIGFDLIWGFAGIMSFGQAVLFGSAGYVAALLARDLGVTSALIVLPAAIGMGLLLALLIGAFLLLGRNSTGLVFVALGTLTASYTAERLARGWYYLGGQNGIPSIPSLTLGSYEIDEGPVFYYFALGILVVVYVLCRLLVRSQFGLALAGLREQETRVAFLGYRVPHLKLIVYACSGAISGLAGGLYCFHEGFVWPSMLGVVLSTQVVLYALFGGVGTLIGAALGVVVIEMLGFWLSESYQKIWPIILGALLLLVIMFRPTGLIGLFVSERERIGQFGRPAKAKRRDAVAPHVAP